VKGHLSLALYDLMDSSLRGKEIHRDVLQRLILFLPLKHREMLHEAIRERNSKVVNFNPTLTALRGCNTAIYYISENFLNNLITLNLLSNIKTIQPVFIPTLPNS
jgi:hypothetical protein